LLSHIDVWFLETQTLDAAALDAARALLSGDERARHDRLVFERDRRDFAFAHALTRTTLSKYSTASPEAWTFGTAEKGKPFITASTGQPLSFNLSHTHGFVACVAAPGIDVGIDVETLDRRVERDAIARRYFAAIEIDGLHALSGEDRTARFFDLWTLKEAYIKATGNGLSHPLDAMSFVFLDTDEIVFTPPPAVRRVGECGAHSEAKDWQFALFAPTPRHRIAVAARSEDRAWTMSATDAATGTPIRPVRLSVR
jgi:4'-phosphopantetheinyl transferase